MKLTRVALATMSFAWTGIFVVGCSPPDEVETEIVDDTLPIEPMDPILEAAPGAFLDLQCGGKHARHPIDSITDRGARFTESGNTETFEHLNTSCNRVEIDTNDHYQSGTHTFTGEVRIGTVSGQSILQIFNAPRSGPIMMIKAYGAGGGTLRKHGGSVTLVTGVANEWVKVKVVHNLGANTLTISINGDEKWSGSGGAGGSFNLKYGNYGTGAPTKVQWRNVSF
jgi:hypothetical protein